MVSSGDLAGSTWCHRSVDTPWHLVERIDLGLDLPLSGNRSVAMMVDRRFVDIPDPGLDAHPVVLLLLVEPEPVLALVLLSLGPPLVCERFPLPSCAPSILFESP